VGRYELVELIGRGGMAEVWRARVAGPEGFARGVALKRPLGEIAADAELRRRFVAEARILAGLHHPNIVAALDFGQDDTPYLVMELVDGWTLAHLLRRRRKLPPGCVAWVAEELSRGLGHVHRATTADGRTLGLVHRDLSPSNIMVGSDGRVRLLDFGTAKVADALTDERTRTGVLIGKVPYMSPEQAAGAPIDARSDQFALGAIVFEMLTGARLFGGEGDAELLARVRAAAIEPPSAREPGVPAALDAACARLIAREPAARFSDCDAAATAFARIAAELRWGPMQLGELVVQLRAEEDAPPIMPRTGRLEPRVRRRWHGGWIAGGVIIVVGGAAFWQLRRHRHEPAPAPMSPPPSTLPAPLRTLPTPPSTLSTPLRTLPTPPSTLPAPPSTLQAPPPTSPAPPLRVRLTIVSTPPGATVFTADGNVALGKAPLSLPLPRSATSLRFILRARDRLPATVLVTPDADQTVSTELAPVPRHRDTSQRALEHAIENGRIENPFE
jgi:serine/threonine protein kinase